MEIVLALGIGALTAAGVWLILRPRTFQVIIGLSLLSYAVNLSSLPWGDYKQTSRQYFRSKPPAIRRTLPILCRRLSF